MRPGGEGARSDGPQVAPARLRTVRISSRALVLQGLLTLVVAAGGFALLTLPPKTARLAPPRAEPLVLYGGYHIHTNRSDGTGTPDAIAEAAARAGLQFVILTDHGDATRPADPPQYRHGVLCLDAVEINTTGGHLVALGLNHASPYPLAGEPRDVIEDVHRLGGWAVAAHPDSPKPELRWRAPNADYDGLEWLNADSEWRDESALHLAAAATRYLFRPAETIASLFERPARTLQRWDASLARHRVVGLAALDAHARLSWSDARGEESGGALLAQPSYFEMFRTVVQAVTPARPLTGEGAADAATLLEALRAGQTFSVVSAIAAPGRLDFTAARAGITTGMGQTLPESDDVLRVHASAEGAPAARLVLFRNGTPFKTASGAIDASFSAPPGVYRVEAYYPGRTLPWMVSNPIYVGTRASVAPPALSGTPAPVRLVDLPGADGWNVEHDPTSTGTPSTDGRAVAFRFALGGGKPAGQFAAAVTSLDESLRNEGFDRVGVTVRADRPMRISVQLRLPGGKDGQRWRQSIYVDATPRTLVLNLRDFLPVEPTSQRPIVAHVKDVLFVVDTLNTSPGSNGTLWLSNVTLGVGEVGR